MMVGKLIRRWRERRALRKGDVKLDHLVEGSTIRILALDCHGWEVGRCIGIWNAFRRDALLGDVRVSESWRRRGVGARLLNAFLREAEQLGALLVHGSIVEHDLERTPGLLPWYQGFNFSVLPSTSEEIGNAVARIEKRLGNFARE